MTEYGDVRDATTTKTEFNGLSKWDMVRYGKEDVDCSSSVCSSNTFKNRSYFSEQRIRKMEMCELARIKVEVTTQPSRHK